MLGGKNVKRMNRLITVLVFLEALLMLSLTFQPSVLQASPQKYFFTLHATLRPPSRPEFAEIMAEEFAKIGIEYILEILEPAVWTEHSYMLHLGKTFEEGGNDLCHYTHGWQRYDPGIGFGFYYYSSHRYMMMEEKAYYRWFNPRFDYLYDLEEAEVNFTRRKEIIWEMLEIVDSELPHLPLWWKKEIEFTRMDIDGYVPRFGGTNLRGMAYATVKGKTAADDVTIICAQPGSPGSASSIFASGLTGLPVHYTMFDALVELDENYKPTVPSLGLAKSWEVSEDGKTYTFHLRDDVYWHDGAKFTSEDVKWTMEKLRDTKVGYMYTSFAAEIPLESIETPDDYTVIFQLTKPHPAFLPRMSVLRIEAKHWWEGIAPEEMRKHEKSVKGPAVGTGPFKFVKWYPEEYLEMEAYDNWYETRGMEPIIDHLYLKFIPEAATTLAALEANEVQQMSRMYTPKITKEIPRLDEDPNISVIRWTSGETECLGFNCQHPNLQNVWVRKAINHIIPRKYICEEILMETADPANQLVPPWQWAHNPNIKPYEYSVEKAQECMEKAGYHLESLKPVEIPMPVYIMPGVIGLIAGAAVGGGITYVYTRRRV